MSNELFNGLSIEDLKRIQREGSEIGTEHNPATQTEMWEAGLVAVADALLKPKSDLNQTLYAALKLAQEWMEENSPEDVDEVIDSAIKKYEDSVEELDYLKGNHL